MNILFDIIAKFMRIYAWLSWFRHKDFPRHIELLQLVPMVLVLALLFVQLDPRTAWLADVGQWMLVASMVLVIGLIVREARKELAATRPIVQSNGKLH